VQVGLLFATTVIAGLRLNCGKTVNKNGCQVLHNRNSCDTYEVMM
jgi:hypothetical protein